MNSDWSFDVADIRPDKVWTGEGLPPVGTEFEWRYGDHGWKTGVALYIGSVYAILKARDQEQHYYLRDMEFRPIRTPEQIAAEEIQRIRDEIGYQRPQLGVCPVEAMYNLGYRKFEIVDDPKHEMPFCKGMHSRAYETGAELSCSICGFDHSNPDHKAAE